MLVMMIFVSDKRFGLFDKSQRVLEQQAGRRDPRVLK
jgi:hypothetical protein